MAAVFNIGQILKGKTGQYKVIKHLQTTVWLAANQKQENVIIKSHAHWRIRNERDILLKYKSKTPHLRPLIDEIEDPSNPPAIVLKYLDHDMLKASDSRRLTRPEIKYVAKSVLEALKVLHTDGLVHTDVKPSNVLLNYKPKSQETKFTDPGDIRFTDVQLCDVENTVSVDSGYARDGDTIGTSIFRSPEVHLQMRWNTATDIWSFGAMLISLIYGEGFHIFIPKVSVDHEDYDVEVLLKQNRIFGPFPESYQEIADDLRLTALVWIIQNCPAETLKPFHLTSTKEISKEDKDFVLKIMKLDPRDRLTAAKLLQDEWFRQD